MIIVSQGHERSIALEVFFKSSLLLSPRELSQILLVADESSIAKNLEDLRFKFGIKNKSIIINKKIIPFHATTSSLVPLSTNSLSTALSLINPIRDVLLTLPTSKDQLSIGKKQLAGYTEYLREHFANQFLAMNFVADKHQIMLVTDHLPLKQVSSTINSNLIVQKSILSLDGYHKFFQTINEIYFAGINPHAGEAGILGNEDRVVSEAIKVLAQKYPSKKFHGPLSGDTLHTISPLSNRLFVYMFHDQGLAPFKALHGFTGLNVSLGLPFLRLSVDHGTAFSLYGKGNADHSGCSFVLAQALSVNQKLARGE